jgi:hypothetical protein
MVNGCGALVRADSVAVEFDDERLVANAGVLLAGTLIDRLGLERLVDGTVELGDRPGAAGPGRKVCSLLQSMALGADSLDDCDVLRTAAPRRCWATGRWRPRRRAPFCARSASATCASSTGCWPRRSSGPGRRGRGPARSGS